LGMREIRERIWALHRALGVRKYPAAMGELGGESMVYAVFVAPVLRARRLGSGQELTDRASTTRPGGNSSPQVTFVSTAAHVLMGDRVVSTACVDCSRGRFKSRETLGERQFLVDGAASARSSGASSP
jgi:hypothetical protein